MYQINFHKIKNYRQTFQRLKNLSQKKITLNNLQREQKIIKKDFLWNFFCKILIKKIH